MNELTDPLNIAATSNDLIIGKGVRFKGTIFVPNTAIINGSFDGEIKTRELIVDEDGFVSGTATANDVQIKGTVKAAITCINLLTIHSTGNIDGSMEYGQISIERGGKFSGSMKQR